MKKSDSTSEIKALKDEVKRLKKENTQLKNDNKAAETTIAKQKVKIEEKNKELKKKRRAEKNADERATKFYFEAIPGHRFSVLIVKLSILIYTQTSCGLRTVVDILKIVSFCLEGKAGKVPCYNTIENWMKKLGLSVYEEDRKAPRKKYAAVIDESIMINREKLFLVLGIPAEHQGRPVNHGDTVVLHMEASEKFTGDDVSKTLQDVSDNVGSKPEYVVSDQGSNLVNGIAKSGLKSVPDISHAAGNIVKRQYGKCDDFKEFMGLLGKIHLKYQLTDKAYLLPPNMRAICRFMNMSAWVEWAQKMLAAYDGLPDKMKEAYAFLLDFKDLISELAVTIDAVKYTEEVCKNDGFNIKTYCQCKKYIIENVIGGANNRRAMFGVYMLDYLDKCKQLLTPQNNNLNISSDIIESTFAVYKAKKSPNKLYGITPFVLFLPLYSKLADDSTAKTFNFKDRLVNVKLRDIDAYASEHMSTNWVTERTKTLRKVV